MKLPLLLAQFLYQHKRLALPGVGIFTLDPSAEMPDPHNKNTHQGPLGIEFKNAVIHQPDDELIGFIQSHTGKIKPVAIADLDSFLTLGAEMLNIGKPFFLEGIGTITRQKGGGFDFSPGLYSAIERASTEKSEKSGKRKSVLEEAHFEPQPTSSRRAILVVALVAGLAIIGWGGYMLYKKNGKDEKKPEVSLVVTDTATKMVDSTTTRIDSTAQIARNTNDHLATKDSSVYKYIILQTYNKERALRRYNQLKSFELKINMDTQDSSFFKLYFRFPAATKDTVHIKDSLSREYAHSVIIER